MSGNHAINARRRRPFIGDYISDMQAMRLEFIGRRNGDVLPKMLMNIYGITHAQALRDLSKWKAAYRKLDFPSAACSEFNCRVESLEKQEGIMKRALTVLGETGDVTVMWDESDDERMIAMIQSKMDQGYQFFIIENRALGGPPMKTRLKKPEDALKHRAISIKDPDLAGAIGVGTIEAVKTPDKPVKATRKAKDAKDAAKNQSVAVKPLKGG